jgi:hypothetical protein
VFRKVDIFWTYHGSDVFHLDLRLTGLTKKPLYKDSPRRSHEEAAEKHETTKQRMNLRRLEGETLLEPSPIASPISPTLPTPLPWWRGSSPPLDYGFVTVAWFISLYRRGTPLRALG